MFAETLEDLGARLRKQMAFDGPKYAGWMRAMRSSSVLV
jgi:hypothetical protein